MRNLEIWVVDLGLALFAAAILASGAAAADNDLLRQKQQAQEKARTLAGELIAAVLDVQLRQLEENGLEALPIYRDIASMKQHIGALATDEMEAIVALLVEAQEGSPEQRPTKFNAARAKIRDVVVQLMAERQRLYRRMQVARLAAEVKQLIALQASAHDTTRSLPERRADERERLALATIEDQADVSKLYYQLVSSLEDVSAWGGQVAAGASDGLRLLKAAQVEPELKRAAQSLGKADFTAAAVSQLAVIKGLRALLEKIEEAQGLVDGDREAALHLARELLRRQQALREQTKQTELTERTAEPLIERQTALQKDLSKLAAALTKFPTTEPLMEQAKAASFEATAQLFEEKKQPALDQQSRVIGSLAQIEKVLQQGLDQTHDNKSAEELAAEIARLMALKKELEVAAREQHLATDAASAKPQVAAGHEKQVADSLARTDQLGDFPGAIDASLAQAKEKVGQAQEAMQNEATKASEARHDAAAAALAAIKQAQAEVEAQLADTIRRQKGVEVGELARAAEALERASAAEREIARQSAEAAAQQGLDAKQAAELAAEQSEVGQVAEKIAAGVKHAAPEASQMLERTMPNLAAANRELAAATQQTGEGNKPAAAKASQAAEQAAQQLADAAAKVREAQGRSAQELEKIAGQQLEQADAARQAVEQASEAARHSASDALARLAEAQRKIAEAQGEQAKAEGKAQEAAAKELTEKIADLKRNQEAADLAAQELARGKTNSPLNAASQQQEVADKSSELAQQTPSQVAQPLAQAAKSAGDAAKETLGGNPAKAESSRQLTHGALDKALEAAEQQAKQAAQLPPGKPDAAAQAKVGEKAGEASDAAKQAGPPGQSAREALEQAKQQAAAARQHLDGGNEQAAKSAQQQTRQSLTDAASKLTKALQELAAKQAGELAQQAAQSRTLGDKVGAVDPGAAAALTQAKQAAERGAKASNQPSQISGAQHQAQQKLDQAAANLAARQQQLRRDRDLAQALADLAKEQQTARDAIAQTAKQLQPSPTDGADAGKKLAAAQALQQAQQQFAAAQTKTGEGAAEVSGQQEVANVPIREGLEIASRLNKPPGAAEEEPGDKPPETADRGQETADGKKEKTAANASPKSQTPNSKSPSQAKPGDKDASQLGTGMVPASPQVTAKQISGPEANAAAASAMAQAMAEAMKAQGKGQPGQGQGESETPREGEASSTAKKGGAAKGGKTADNQKPEKGDLETADAADADSRGKLGGQDASGGGLKVESEPWFAKLPPALQSAIQAKSRGKAPRGYEERLRRYFESVD